MSGQGQQKGGQQYGNPYPGNPGYMDQYSLYNQNGLQSGMPGNLGGGFFSVGGSKRPAFLSAMNAANQGQPNGGFGNNPNNFFGNNFGSSGSPGFGNNPNGFFGAGNFAASNPGATNGFGNNPNNFFGSGGAIGGGTGTSNPPIGTSYGGVANPGNVDPNSPEYAAYYNSLPPSTRLYMPAPGSAQAQQRYDSYNASMANPNSARF